MEQLFPLLSVRDIVIDGGNAHYSDTERRIELAKEYDLRYLGSGTSGGEEGALHGPAIMETIAEAYDLMSRGLKLSAREMADVLADWNKDDLSSYLFEISETILRCVDPETGRPLVEMILDEAAQKGTGKWSTQGALDIGSPAPTIAMAVFARVISALKEERVRASTVLSGPDGHIDADRNQFLRDLFAAV